MSRLRGKESPKHKASLDLDSDAHKPTERPILEAGLLKVHTWALRVPTRMFTRAT